jgi:hypothetical protein
VAVPSATPDTTPVPETTFATPGFPEVHVPEGVASARVVVPPKQRMSVPVIVAGIALTVTVAVV